MRKLSETQDADCPQQERAKVLAVEDDSGVLLLIKRALERNGMSVRTASTGQEALGGDLEWPDMMVLDYSLPDTTGDQLVSELRRRGKFIPFVVTTGRGDERIAVKMMKMGAKDYIVKDSGSLDVLPHVMTKVFSDLRVRRDLERARQELERQRLLSVRGDRLRSLGELSAGIAHELNQPLAGVRGLAEFLQIKASQGDVANADLERRLALIIEQVDRMTHIIDHVRMFARSSVHREQGAVVVNETICSGLALSGLRSGFSGIEVVREFCEGLPLVRGNSYAYEEVVINLMSNAAHALQRRMEKEPDLSRDKCRITVRTRRSESNPRCVVLEVHDFGGGIAPQDEPYVFDTFFTTKSMDHGTGLGLPICRAIMEESGGAIDFVSIPGESTTFSVRLPVYEGV